LPVFLDGMAQDSADITSVTPQEYVFPLRLADFLQLELVNSSVNLHNDLP
jgi:hypothetical protein